MTTIQTTTQPGDPVAAALAATVPGPTSAAGLAGLFGADLSDTGRIDALIAVSRHRRWLEALEVHLLAGLDDQPLQMIPGHPDALADYGQTREQVGCALGLSPATAERRLKEARAIAAYAPKTLDLLAQGRVHYLHAKNLAEATSHLGEDTALQVEDQVITRFPDQAVGAARKAVERAVLKVDPDAARARRERAVQDRRVTLQPHPDGMAWFGALLPAEDALRIDQAVDTAARELPADGRTLDQKRADTLVHLVTQDHVRGSWTTTRPGVSTQVNVTIPLDTLIGLNDEPAELTGYGPITAHHARHLAAQPGTLYRRLLTDPGTARIVKVDPTRYRPTADCHRTVTTRDTTCRFPHCTRNATTCDLDHVTPFRHGGPTIPDNLLSLCRRHHLIKHRAGWTLTHDTTTGHAIWTTPTGHQYRD